MGTEITVLLPPESDTAVEVVNAGAFDTGAFDEDAVGGVEPTAAGLSVAEPFVAPPNAALFADALPAADPFPPEAALLPLTGHGESPLPELPPTGCSQGA